MLRGIVIAVPKKYEEITLTNIKGLRNMGCELPIELWEIGEEVTQSFRAQFLAIPGVCFRQVSEFTNDPSHWKGFQVKAFAFYYSQFEEVLLCDADVILHENPELLFEDENYKKTGAYFFRDLEKWQFKRLTNPLEQFKQRFVGKKFYSAAFFNKRKEWILSLLPIKKNQFPKEWEYFYDDNLPEKPVKEALQESGVVAMDKIKHRDSVEIIFQLNDNHQETYQYIWGDKETFWIGCVMADTEFYFNDKAGYMSPSTNRLTHDYKEKIFFSQKG